MSTQSEPDLRALYDALVYSGSKWKPWLWWVFSGTAAGALAGAAFTIAPGQRVWLLPFVLVLFIYTKKLYVWMEGEYLVRSIRGTNFFSVAFWIAFVAPFHALSKPYGLFLSALVIGGGVVLGSFHAVIQIWRVSRFYLWLVSAAVCGALAAGAGIRAVQLVDAPLSSLQANVLEGALVGFVYCVLLGGALLWIFWDSSDLFARLADWYFSQERLLEAADAYGLAISIRPDDSNLHYNRGVVYSKLGQLDEALADYDKALSLNPKDALALGNRGIVYSDRGELDLALADFENAVLLNPKDAFAFNNRGNAYLGLGDLTSALADFDRAIELDPTDAMAYTNRGAIYSKLGDVQRAIEEYGSAIEHQPDYPNSYANRAFAYYKLGEYERGIADCDHAVDLRPDHAATYSNRGLCYAALGNAELAAADFRQALSLPCQPVVREEALGGLRALGLNADGLDSE
jgi:tetratricopeptide (TPR) repeat protein